MSRPRKKRGAGSEHPPATDQAVSHVGTPAPDQAQEQLFDRQQHVSESTQQVTSDRAGSPSQHVIPVGSETGVVPAELATMANVAAPSSVIELPATFDATTVRAVYGTMRAALAESTGDLTLDGTRVETVDTAAGQLLAAVALAGRHVHLKASAKLEDFLKVTAIEVVLAPEH
jgi:hypothetical protein